MKAWIPFTLLLAFVAIHINLSAQHIVELPDEAAFIDQYKIGYARTNPWVSAPQQSILFRENTYIAMPVISQDPLNYLYAHGYSQTLSGTQFYAQQQTVARQFTYGPMGNPMSIPHLTNTTYNIGGYFLAPGFGALDSRWMYGIPVVGATSLYNTIRPRTGNHQYSRPATQPEEQPQRTAPRTDE